jgi:hypothetical protein
MDTDIWRFLCACAGGDEPRNPFCAAEAIAEADAGQANSLFTVFHQGQWYSYVTSPSWTAIAMAAVLDPDLGLWVVTAMSQAGELWELQPRTRAERLGQLKRRMGMTNLGAADDAIYACGMGRIAFRREHGGAAWTDVSAPWPSADEGVVGFMAIGGRNLSLVYAIGWKGEIWTLADRRWSREDSPTNANLNALAISADDEVFCVGDNGVMLRGRQGMWSLVDTGTDFNLQDVCIHGGQVFVATDFQVFRLEDEGLVPDLASGDEDVPLSCLKLVSGGAGGRLYSIGPSDVFERRDDAWYPLA